MISYLAIALGAATAYVSYRLRKVENPVLRWRRFHQKGAVPLDAVSCKEFEGIYAVEAGSELLGEKVVIKWSYTIQNRKPEYHISIFGSEDGCYSVCTAKRYGNEILLSGYWRKLDGSGIGTLRLMANEEGLLFGVYGENEDQPGWELRLNRQAPLPVKKPLSIIGHRGGARNVDFYAVSENSLELFRMASRLGNTGVEIDVRLTKDGVPVLFHDSFLSAHTIKDSVYSGAITSYTLEELKRKELRKGGKAPTLREALYVLLYETPIETVWLDIKFHGDLREIRALQQEFQQKAESIGRDMKIYIGIPSKKIMECFMELPDRRQALSLTELEPEDAAPLAFNVWAPQYTDGPQPQKVKEMQAQGIKVFVWSLDHPVMIRTYLKEGGFDGVVTNAAPVVAYEYYTSDVNQEVERLHPPKEQKEAS